jgi:hypothetical protein
MGNQKPYIDLDLDLFWFIATFSNISAISWRPVLVVEKAKVPGENHDNGQATPYIEEGQTM